MLSKCLFLKNFAHRVNCVQFQRPILAKLCNSAPKSDVAKGRGLINHSDKGYGLHEADWNREEDLFQFTRGRFVYDESENLTRRRIQFNMNNLADIAARTIGATRCDRIEKCPDGLYNKAYMLTMDNGKEFIGKVPNPNAGVPHYTTASEVATMDFVSCILSVNRTLTCCTYYYSLDAKCSTDPCAAGICVELQSGPKQRRRSRVHRHGEAAWYSYRQDLGLTTSAR